MWEENTIFSLLIVQLGKRAVSSQLVDALDHAILDALPPLHMAMGGGVRMSVIAFLLSIMAGVIADSISGRLDERDGGDEPGARPCSQYGYRKSPKVLAWGISVLAHGVVQSFCHA